MTHRLLRSFALVLLVVTPTVAGVRLTQLTEFPHASLDGARVGAISPDGAHVYVGADNNIAVLARDGVTGLLSFVESETFVLDGLSAIALSPAGDHVYVAAGGLGDGLVVYTRNTSTGAITYASDVDPGNPLGVVVSPDGTHAYVTSNGSPVVVYSRNPITGALTFVEYESGGFDVLTALSSPHGLVLSPDGAHLYVTASGSLPGGSGIAVYARNGTTGELTFVHSVHNGGGSPIEELYGTETIDISPDGAHVYVGSRSMDSALLGFSRNAGTGMLTLLQVVRNDQDGVYGLAEVHSVDVSNDGTRVHVRASLSDQVPCSPVTPARAS